MARPINQNTFTIAMRLVSEFGITKLDTLVDYERVQQLREFAKALRSETGVTYYTSRQHVAKACRRLRHESAKQ